MDAGSDGWGEIACAILFARVHIVQISTASNDFRVASVAIENCSHHIYLVDIFELDVRLTHRCSAGIIKTTISVFDLSLFVSIAAFKRYWKSM
jgi:hypothetical protein